MEYFQKMRSYIQCEIIDPRKKNMLADRNLVCGTDYEYDFLSGIITFKKPVKVYDIAESKVVTSRRVRHGRDETTMGHIIEFETSKICFPRNNVVHALESCVTDVMPPMIEHEHDIYECSFPIIGTRTNKVVLYFAKPEDIFNKDRFGDPKSYETRTRFVPDKEYEDFYGDSLWWR